MKNSTKMFYKKILDIDLLNRINTSLQNCKYTDNSSNVAKRMIAREEYVEHDTIIELKRTIITFFSDYFVFDIGHIRFYKQQFGEIKKHTDASLDNKSNYTLLIYLTDEFDGGELFLHNKETSEDHLVKPEKGYGILFDKNTLHWSPEVYGEKNILMIDLIIYRSLSNDNKYLFIIN
jgi:predicted 2-oxoglutarate/Fe(II)-dependent dioxygenase YbiX